MFSNASFQNRKHTLQMTVNSYTFNNEGFETSLKSSFISTISFCFCGLESWLLALCWFVMK